MQKRQQQQVCGSWLVAAVEVSLLQFGEREWRSLRLGGELGLSEKTVDCGFNFFI